MIFAAIRKLMHDQHGASAVLFALTLPVAIGFLGLGSETALWFYTQRDLQKIADVAAYNGAVEFSDSNNASLAEYAAGNEADYHGFDASTGVITVSSSAADRSVQVDIAANYPRLFSALFRTDTVSIGASAVASFSADGTACILALHLDAPRAINVAGSADVDLVGCSIMSNSVTADSFYQGGGGHISAPCIRAVGGIEQSGGVTLTECSETWPYSPKADDPFADISAPDVTAACSLVPTGTGTIVVPPGRYCGGFDLSGDYHLTGGVYVIDDGIFRINSGAHVSGQNVTFYLTDDAHVAWNGNAHIDLEAPTSGTYEGVLVFADRDPNDTNDLLFNGTANSTLVGAIYAPGREVNMLGDFQGSNGCTQIVSSTIVLSGNTSFSTNCTGTGTVNIAMAGRTRLVQ